MADAVCMGPPRHSIKVVAPVLTWSLRARPEPTRNYPGSNVTDERFPKTDQQLIMWSRVVIENESMLHFGNVAAALLVTVQTRC